MSEDLEVDARQHPHDDADATGVRPALVDDLLGPSASAGSPAIATTDPATTPYGPPPDDDLMTDEEFLTPGGQRPSRLTRVLLVLLILAVGILVGVQLGKAAGGSTASAPGGTGQSRRFGPPGAGSPGGGGSAAPRSTLGSSAPAVLGTVTSAKSHSLVVKDADGVSHTVTLTDATTVTKPYSSGALGAGDAVTVFGSRAADGSVNATSIVVR